MFCFAYYSVGPIWVPSLHRSSVDDKSRRHNKRRVKLLSACCEFDPFTVNNVEIWNDILFVSTILECQIFDSWCDRGKPIEQDDAQRYYKCYRLF